MLLVALGGTAQRAVRDAEPRVPQRDGVPARGQASGRRVRVVPPERAVPGHADDLLRLPLGAAARTTATRRGSARSASSAIGPTSWTAVRWNHGAQAGVPLNADHRTTRRASRATAARTSAPASVTCVGCHQKDYAATTVAEPRGRGLPDDVRRVSPAERRDVAQHRRRARSITTRVSARRHARDAGLRDLSQEQRLQGHAARLRRLPSAPTTTATQNPNHAAAGFPTLVRRLPPATDPSFRGGGANASTTTRVFALVGVHATQACAACHMNNVYKGTPRDCVGCHQANYNRTQNPNHVAAGFSTDVRVAATGRPIRPGAAAAASTTTASSRWSACTPRRPARRAT